MSDLELYDVPHRRHVARMKLSKEDAKAFRERDGLDVKKVGTAKPAARQDVTAPPYAVDENGDKLPEAKSGSVRLRSRQVSDKSRQGEDK